MLLLGYYSNAMKCTLFELDEKEEYVLSYSIFYVQCSTAAVVLVLLWFDLRRGCYLYLN